MKVKSFECPESIRQYEKEICLVDESFVPYLQVAKGNFSNLLLKPLDIISKSVLSEPVLCRVYLTCFIPVFDDLIISKLLFLLISGVTVFLQTRDFYEF